MKEFKATEKTWWISVDETNIHYGSMETNQTLSTMGDITTFDNEEDWKNHLTSLGITPEEPNLEHLEPKPLDEEFLNNLNLN